MSKKRLNLKKKRWILIIALYLHKGFWKTSKVASNLGEAVLPNNITVPNNPFGSLSAVELLTNLQTVRGAEAGRMSAVCS